MQSDHMYEFVGGLPRLLSGEESACQAGDMGLTPGLRKSPGEGNNNQLQYSCHRQRSLSGYSMGLQKELDVLTD